MFRVLPILVLMLVPVAPAASDETPRRAATAEQIVAILHDSKMDYEKDLRTTPFSEVIEDLAQKLDVKFIVNKRAIGDTAAQLGDAKAERFTATSTKGMTLHAFLRSYLPTVPIDDLTYAVRTDHIEITTKTAMREEMGLDESEASDASPSRMNLPVVCLAAREKPLASVLEDLRRVYGVNIVVESAVKPQLKTMITEQLLNVPADTALELIAGQADLGVVRKGNTFRIISNPKG